MSIFETWEITNFIHCFYMSFLIDKYYFKPDSILNELPIKELNFLKQKMSRIEIKKGKIVFREGSFSKGVYILRKGKIKIYQTNKDSKEQILYIHNKGEAIGYCPLICEQPHPVSAAAIEDCVISFIPKKYFLLSLNNSPAFARRLLIKLACKLTIWINKFTLFAQQPVRERVALSLLILNEQYKKRIKNISRLLSIFHVKTSLIM